MVCNDLNVNDCYVGHTTDMTKRKWAHKSVCNNENNKGYNYKIYQIIRENGGWDNWSMLLIEKFPCKDKHEACKRERELYEELDSKMNSFRPYRTHEELKEEIKQNHKKYIEEHKAEIIHYHEQYGKKYREENKDILNEKGRKYRQDHKEELKEKMKEKVECKYCAKLRSKCNMSYHIKICKSKPVKE